MSEQLEEAEVIAPDSAPAAPLAEPAAAPALALGGRGDKLPPESAAYLKAQTELARLQMEHLHEQRTLQVEHLKQQERHLRLRYFGDRLRIGLQILGILAGLAVAAFLGAMAWNAHEDHGVAIEAFSVPPDLVQRGLTGQVVASQLLDRLAALQVQTVTSRPASTYANDWGGDIKVEIPETGVSIGELNRYLRDWLGSETRITGEVVRTASGLAVTARAGASPGRRFEGAETQADELIGKAAEAIYADTQPYRHAVYLASQKRTAEATAAFARLARAGAPEDRAWAYVGWASIMFQQDRMRDAARLAETAIRLDPRLQPAYPIRGLSLSGLGREEEDLAHARRELALLRSGRAIGVPGGADATESRVRFIEGTTAAMVGDFSRAAKLVSGIDTIAFEGEALGYDPRQYEASLLIGAHDLSSAARLWAAEPQSDPTAQLYVRQQWGDLARFFDGLLARGVTPPEQAYRSIAEVYAHVGRLAEADTWIDKTALDCAHCLGTRGLIAAQKHDWTAADRWYAEASRRTPSIPFADTDWAQALLIKGDLDGAIAKLKEAHRRSPRFADPLEFWGEALMRKGDLGGAIDKFSAADKSAPHWGRNHMMWGEALMLQGRYAEARRQYEIASGLDQSRPDRAALDVLLARTKAGPLHG